jgi:hypothetical protein
MRRTRAALASALALLALAGGAAQGKAAQDSAAQGAQRVILISGPSPVKGLPFFPANALAALCGSYGPIAGAELKGASAPDGELLVWYTREALVLGNSWKRTGIGGPTAFALARPQGSVLVLVGPHYYLFFEPPAGSASGDLSWRAFVQAFDRKFQAFLEKAATDAELSFPAYVDY